MGLWGKRTGEFIDVVHCTEDRPDVPVHRFERDRNEIAMGARLAVREGRSGVMVNEGQLGKGQVAEPMPALPGRACKSEPADAS